jgi:hypothetical protein
MPLDIPPQPIKMITFDALSKVLEPHIYNEYLFGEVTLSFYSKKHLTLQDLCRSSNDKTIPSIDIHRIVDGVKCNVKTYQEFKRLISSTNHFDTDQSFYIGERDRFCFNTLIVYLKDDIIVTITYCSINIKGKRYGCLDNDVIKKILHVAKDHNIKVDVVLDASYS